MQEIRLDRVHIQNFRSVEELSLDLPNDAILFGQNDAGKTNIITAIQIALARGDVEPEDVYVSKALPSPDKREIIIDLRFVPINPEGERIEAFPDNWLLHFGSAVAFDQQMQQFFAYRTVFSFDETTERYSKQRLLITSWEEDAITLGNTLSAGIMKAFDCISLDAQRDMTKELNERYSRWNQEMARIKIDKTQTENIEEQLVSLGNTIVSNSPFLTDAQSEIQLIESDVSESAAIYPISRNINDLYKGLDVYLTRHEGVPLSLSHYGSGSKSKAVFASMRTLIKQGAEGAGESPYYCLAIFEEPEAHIHPQAQKRLAQSFRSLDTQRIMTTHSPYILSMSDISAYVFVSHNGGKTNCSLPSDLKKHLEKDDFEAIKNRILSTRGEILFSSAVALAEGQTEEQTLPLFYERKFGRHPFEDGVSIIGVDGHAYKPFVAILDMLDIPWFIFSDGEENVVKNVSKQLKDLGIISADESLRDCDRCIVLDPGLNFETYLIDAGYQDEIIQAINSAEDEDENVSEPYFDYFIRTRNGTAERIATDQTCDKCNQKIWTQGTRDYSGDEGVIKALKDCMKNGKVKYSAEIAKHIIQGTENPCVPEMIDLFLGLFNGQTGQPNEVIE